MRDTLDHLLLLADRLSLQGYDPDTWEQRDGEAAKEARLDLDAVQHAIAILKGEARLRRAA